MHEFLKFRYVKENGEIIKLTILENKVLNALLTNRGKLITFKEFGKVMYFDENIKISLVVDCICRLRKKLGNELEIVNVTGKGYIIG